MPDSDADPNVARARLESQLAELEARQSRIAEDLAEPLNADSGEQAVEMEDDASLEGQGALGEAGPGTHRGRNLRRVRPLRRGYRPGPA